MNKWLALLLIPLAILPISCIPLLIAGGDVGDCVSGVTVDPANIPADLRVAGYGHDQLVMAATIIAAGTSMNLDAWDQTVAVMTAMGESSLINLNYGDKAGPDSRGLFQQRAGWGTEAERMDPFRSSILFYERLVTIQDRHGREPTLVAHEVQINSDPWHYERWWDDAVDVVEALSGVDLTLLANGTCTPAAPATPGLDGWSQPAAGPVTSEYGPRSDPKSGKSVIHTGTDLAGGGDGGPIYAANAGVVTYIGTDRHGGWQVDIDHGQGRLVTRYKHMWSNGIYVTIGDHVTSGQHIAAVGSSGYSTGPHLHFAVLVNGQLINSTAFMKERGIHPNK